MFTTFIQGPLTPVFVKKFQVKLAENLDGLDGKVSNLIEKNDKNEFF